ncbi:MAG: hypothetical protein M0Q53_02350 [Prolixibacteraceae bacterium]|jgi:hypothetical protein|nr:hypothetical protein [Prolixibacteraceae bacterium]
MKHKLFFTLFALFILTFRSLGQEADKKTSQEGNKYNIDNCINKFNMDKTVKTPVGYQYWFIEQNFLPDGLTCSRAKTSNTCATQISRR